MITQCIPILSSMIYIYIYIYIYIPTPHHLIITDSQTNVCTTAIIILLLPSVSEV